MFASFKKWIEQDIIFIIILLWQISWWNHLKISAFQQSLKDDLKYLHTHTNGRCSGECGTYQACENVAATVITLACNYGDWRQATRWSPDWWTSGWCVPSGHNTPEGKKTNHLLRITRSGPAQHHDPNTCSGLAQYHDPNPLISHTCRYRFSPVLESHGLLRLSGLSESTT